jgi:hypothetical protein
MKHMLELNEKIKTGKTAQEHDISPEAVQGIIDEYQEGFIQCMLLNGYALMTEHLRVEVVPIQRRNYVLKGKTYNSTRVYKLKASMGDPIYNRICARWDAFRDDLEDDE